MFNVSDSAIILFTHQLDSNLAVLALGGMFDVMTWGAVTSHYSLAKSCGFNTDADCVVDLTQVNYMDMHTFGEVIRWAQNITGKVIFLVQGISHRICEIFKVHQYFSVIAVPA